MKALGKLKKEVGIWLYDAEEPTCGRDDLLIKMRQTAICGTDIHIYNWDEWAQNTIPVPMTVGHEFVGDVIEVGSDVKGYQVGDRVSGEGHITCGHCRNCRAGTRYLCRNVVGIGVHGTGCFSEYMAFPAENAFKIVDDISDECAAVLDPFGNSTHAALSFNLVGEDVLITGAGPTGLMAAAIAKHVGARYVVITDINDYRLELAKKMGVTQAVNVKTTNLKEVMTDLGMTEGFDVGLEMSGSPQAFSSMLDVMNNGSKVVLLGILPNDTQIPWDKVVFNGITIKGIYGREMFETWYKMANLLKSGLDITPAITHKFSIDDFQQGFDVMLSGQSGKVILQW